jgi:ubiquinone/menaquinone biosynthesis C-methylase UbiE
MARTQDVERFERWSATYDRSPAQRLFFTRVHRALCDALLGGDVPPARVADIGCGTGRLLATLRERMPSTELIGLDPAPGMIAAARRRFAQQPSILLEVASASALPLADQTLDAATTTMSFHHWDDQQAGLREAARVLRPQGRLLIADMFAMGLVGRLSAAVVGRRHGRGFRTDAEMGELLNRAGFTSWRRVRMLGRASPICIVEARRGPG